MVKFQSMLFSTVSAWSNLNPLQDSSDFGRGVYITAVHIVGQHLQSVNNCNCELVD